MRLKASLLVAALAVSSHAAFADTFNFSFTGQDHGSGIFTTTATGTAGVYDITGISGTFNANTITSLLAVGTYPPPNEFVPNDNELFFPAESTATGEPASFLDLGGVAFNLSNGNKVNIYYSDGYFVIKGANGGNLDTLTSFNVTAATPEPSSLLLLGTGLLGAVGTLRRRFA